MGRPPLRPVWNPGGESVGDPHFSSMTHTHDDPSESWIDETLRTWFAIAPVDGSFVGLHQHDQALPDLSPQGVADARAELQRAVARRPARTPDENSLRALDEELMADALAIRLWEYETRWLLGNPSVHAGEAVFSLMSLLLPQHGGGEFERLEALHARLTALPTFLDQATQQLDRAPLAWTERAVRECRGAHAFLSHGLAHVPLDNVEAVSGAVSAIETFEDVLTNTLSNRTTDRIGCGAEGLALLIERGHRLDRSAEEIAAYAREEMARTQGWVREHARHVGLQRFDDLPRALGQFHPESDDYYDAFGAVWRGMKALAGARNLLTWPDFPIRYAPRPEWSRAAAPDLYFLCYRSPAAYHRPDVHTYMVPALPDPETEDLQAFLAANNDSVIKLNHVVHHGGIGHHVQNWHAFRSPLRIGRVAAVDCSSRVAMFSSGTMAEGWACYATDLMAEAGGLTELEQFAEHAGRIRMCARAIVDVGIHLGDMDLEQAAAFYVEHAGMSAAAAWGEAVKNSMFPGAALMYLIGTDLIHELRAELIAIQGDDFDLCTFHDAFLSWGSIPVAVIGREMRRLARAGLPLGAHGTVSMKPPDEGACP